jgi:periplasmic protein TonB
VKRLLASSAIALLTGVGVASAQLPEGFVPPEWIIGPNDVDLGDYYPDRARRQGRGGRVTLSCIMHLDTTLTCTASEEHPADQGFGEAAVLASRNMRMTPPSVNGEPIADVPLSVNVVFRPL